MEFDCGILLKDVWDGSKYVTTNKISSGMIEILKSQTESFFRQYFSFYKPFPKERAGSLVRIKYTVGGSTNTGNLSCSEVNLFVAPTYVENITPFYYYLLDYWHDSRDTLTKQYAWNALGWNGFLEWDLTIEESWIEFSSTPFIPFTPPFDWKAWAIAEKSKLNNFQRGNELKFFENGMLFSGSSVILGGTLGFTLNNVKYTLDDIISGTLTSAQLGKTFNEGMAKCNGILVKVGGIIGAFLSSSVWKVISGVFSTGGIFYLSWKFAKNLIDYTSSLSGSMDNVTYPGWWTELGNGTTYTQNDSGSGVSVVPGGTHTQGLVDNWENYGFFDVNDTGYVNTSGVSSTGTSVSQGNVNLGTVSLAMGQVVGLDVTGKSILIDTTGKTISIDTTDKILPIDIEGKTLPVDVTDKVLSIDTTGKTLLVNTTGQTIPVTGIPDSISVHDSIPTSISVSSDIPTQITASGAIELVAPASIPLTAPSEGVDMIFDTTSMEAIKAISDNIASRTELETTRSTSEAELIVLQKQTEQTKIDNKQIELDKLKADLAVSTSEAALRAGKFGTGTNQLDYVLAQVQAYNNLHDIAERESILLGQKQMFPQGLIPSLVASHFPAFLGEIQQSKITDNIVDNVDNHKDDLMNNSEVRNLLFGEMWFDVDTLIKQDLKTKYGDILDEFDGLEFNNSIIDKIINKCLEVKEKMGV